MNYKAIARFWLMVVLLGVSLLPTISTQAQEPGFTETFDHPTLPGWEHSPNVSVVDGVLRVEPGGFTFRGGEWGDQSLSVRVRRSGEGALVSSYCVSDVGAYYVLIESDFLALQREAGGAVAELGNTPFLVPTGEWFQVSVTLTDGKHTVTLDPSAGSGQALVLTVTDPDPLPSGGVGFEVLGEAVGEFDDLVLTAAGEAPPPVEATPIPQKTPVAEAPVSSVGVPAYQSLPWIRLGGPPGGLGYDIRYNFADPNIWYVTDAWAGLHMSTDRGLTWFTSNQGITTRFGPAGDVIPIFCATVDPHDPNIVWIGTQNTGDIYKSTDGGCTWTEMDNGVDQDILPLSFRGFTVDPRASDIVYAMGEIGSAGWTPDGSSRRGLEMDLTQGVVYKTTDGGEHWTEIWRGDSLARYCWIDPRDPDVFYVSTGIFDREAANTDVEVGLAGGVGILKSTDGGQTWRVLNEENGLLDLYVGSLYMHPENPDVLLAAASENNWSYYEGRNTAGIYLTEDGGEHWDRVLTSEPLSAGGFGELFGSVEYCLSDPNVAYAGSQHAVYRSDDGGHTWQRFGRPDGTWGPPGVFAGFPIDMQCDPQDPMRIFVNNYQGGNFLSSDGGQTWVLASQGYTGALVKAAAVAPGQPWTVFAGNLTGFFRSDDGGSKWIGLSQVITHETSKAATIPPFRLDWITDLAVDPENADHVLATSSNLAYSYDGGHNWHGAHLPGAPGPPIRLAFAPSDPTIVYAAAVGLPPSLQVLDCFPLLAGPEPGCDQPGAGLYVSRDGGTSWAAAGGEQARDIAIVALAVHPDDPNTVYASMPTAGVFKTTDGGQTWTPRGTGLPSLPALTFALDPASPETIFAGLSGGGIYRSADGGLSWSQSSAGMDAEAVIRSIVVDPTNSQIVYAADWFNGVYVSIDSGSTWRAINDGLVHRSVNILSLSDDGTVLYAGIEGDGVYRLGTPAGEPAPAPTATETSPPVPSEAEEPTPTQVAAAPTSTLPPAQPTAPPEVAPSPIPVSPEGRGICGGVAALPLVLVGLVWINRRRR